MLNLPLDAKIRVIITTPPDKERVVLSKSDYIAGETRAVEVKVSANPNVLTELKGLVKEWDIDGETYNIGVEQA